MIPAELIVCCCKDKNATIQLWFPETQCQRVRKNVYLVLPLNVKLIYLENETWKPTFSPPPETSKSKTVSLDS